MKRALQPVISNVVVAWDLAIGWAVTQVPSPLPPLFLGDSLVVYGQLTPPQASRARDNNKGNKAITAKATLTGTLGSKNAAVYHAIHFTIALANDHGNVHGDAIHCLAARWLIQEKQDDYNDTSHPCNDAEKEATKEAVISVSKAANVASKFTSFVAVYKENHQPVARPLKRLPWGGQDVMMDCKDDTSGSSEEDVEEDEDEEGRFDLPVARFKSAVLPPPRLNVLAQSPILACSAPSPNNRVTASQQKKEAPAILSMISLQKASGAWDFTDQLVSLCGTSRDALITGCPTELAVDTAEGKLLWATALALVLLMGKFLDQKDEWEMIAEKGKKWMKKNLSATVKCDDVLKSAAVAVGVQI